MEIKGIFFSLDALIALFVVIVLVFVAGSLYTEEKKPLPIDYLSKDLLKTFSQLKVGDLDNSYIDSLIQSNEITNKENTILEQAGEFWALGKFDTARNLIANVIEQLIPPSYGVGVYFNNEEVFSKKPQNERDLNLVSSKTYISGIESGRGFLKGKSSRVFLTGIKERISTTYVYYGGYIGDGNITSRFVLPNVISVQGIELEMNQGNNFSLSINNNFSGTYVKKAPYLGADAHIVNSSSYSNIRSGLNTIQLNFTNPENNYIGGGFFKVRYLTDDLSQINTTYIKEYLPGVQGLINEYSSFSIPGDIKAMTMLFHYKSPFTIFVNLGNTTLYEGSSPTETTIILDNATILSKIKAQDLSRKTVPLRIGTRNASYDIIGNADIILITDYSGSMKKSVNDNSDQGNAAIDCDNLQAYPNARKTSLAKCLDKKFVDRVMNFSGNKIWPVFIHDNQIKFFTGNASDANDIKAYIDSFSQGKEFTCLSCAINKGYDILANYTNPDRLKFILLMTDGIPTHCSHDLINSCLSNSSQYSSTQSCQGYCDFQGLGEGCQFEGCSDSLCDNPIKNTLYSANRTFKDLNTTIFTVGFGLVTECSKAVSTLINVANSTNGSYAGSDNVTALEQIYKTIADQIIELSYKSQSLVRTGPSLPQEIYSDSYITFDYTPVQQITLIPLTFESPKFNNTISSGTFDIPQIMNITDIKVISYSEERWTDNVYLNNKPQFDIQTYGKNYSDLGDPYIVQLSIQDAVKGKNTVNVTTGTPNNLNGGSPDDKVIYTLGLNPFMNYSGIHARAEGCKWTLEFDDSTSTIVTIPSFYNGSSVCEYTSFTHSLPASLGSALDDSISNAIFLLFQQLDPDNDGRLLAKLGPDNLNIDTLAISGIPFLWGPVLAEVRIWI